MAPAFTSTMTSGVTPTFIDTAEAMHSNMPGSTGWRNASSCTMTSCSVSSRSTAKAMVPFSRSLAWLSNAASSTSCG